MRTSRIISGIASAVLATGVVALGAGGVGATGAPPPAVQGGQGTATASPRSWTTSTTSW